MRKAMLIGASLAAMATAAETADVRFAERFGNLVDGERLVEVAPDDTLVFDGGRFVAEGKLLLIIADSIRVDAPTVILSLDPESAPPPVAGTAKIGATGAIVERRAIRTPFPG